MPTSEQASVEKIKEGSAGLRGTIAQELMDGADNISDATSKLLKFHGAYLQDHRDLRKARRNAGLGKLYTFMVRSKISGGKINSTQFLAELALADEFGDGTLRLTTRQGTQIHGVAKSDLWATIHHINAIKLSTQSACGDVERNVACCPAPFNQDPVRGQLQELADRIAEHLRPRTRAYHEIWIEDPENAQKQLVVGRPDEDEPIYGAIYLPRKFKTGIALCSDNCVDVYTQDVGLLAVVQNDSLAGFNILVGGGMGTTPSDSQCSPALAKRMAFVEPAHVLTVLTAIVLVQRDHGDRTNRKQARLKYLIRNWGLPRFKATVEEYLSSAERLCGLPPGTVPRPLMTPDAADVVAHMDHLGWHEQGDGKWFLGLPIENGRIADGSSVQLKSALRQIFGSHCTSARITAQQNLLLCDISAGTRAAIDDILKDHGVATIERISNARRFAFACPAMPTCSLAITESERVLPAIIDDLEMELARLGLGDAQFGIHMTGCPNGCARPYNSDIGIVGRSVNGRTGEGKYTIFVGGNLLGTRMNTPYADLVPQSSIVSTLRPLFVRFKQDRFLNESFGDFCHRVEQLRLLPGGMESTSNCGNSQTPEPSSLGIANG
ncbi:MAG TPA: NADPH-dependent assimilatory sulfite reductase hemoprotein subunit [Schlesneria sp.]|jgi:sulfite reductase (ferredoxin)